MSKIMLLAGLSVILVGCLGMPFVVVRGVVPPNSFALGERFVVYGADRDRVEVEPYDGMFRSLYFVVEDRDVEIYDFVVTYDNGQRERYDARLVFNHGVRSRYFALRGDSRHIRDIEFRYRTLGPWADDRAHVAVYGVR